MRTRTLRRGFWHLKWMASCGPVGPQRPNDLSDNPDHVSVIPYFPQVPLDLISHLRNGRQAGRGMCEYGSVNPEHWRYPWDLRSSCLHRTCGLAWRLSVTYACHTQTSSSREAKPDSALAHHAHALETIGLDADIPPPKRRPARVSTQNRCHEKKLRLLQMT